ncbi:Cassette chromosome recombinase B [Rhodococcus sp. AW25M09]|uniref:recombinase family protein n=1 Tax=Rhodococcus sp. AW25M09 TaxID=1268303 RepID=UPI0002ABF41C|nr:recombinase family protein [Rhodococcus sp. AW25M09]CCQ17539.1 Cassette chromosome recombinase B [Rhodococcus sp. AW25M09]
MTVENVSGPTQQGEQENEMTTMQAFDQREHAGPKLKGLRVIGYARVSTSAQERAHGLGAQSDEMRRYCQANELQLLTVTYDVMSSGSVPKLFGRQTAIAAIESGLADGLLVRALDRATRDQLDAASIAKRANTNGWTLLDCNGANSSDASQRLLFDIRVAMAAEEKRKISERTKEGLRRAKAQGQQLGRPSKIDPSIVAEIIAMRQEDGLSAKVIARKLDEYGVPTPGQGLQWHHSTIRRLLQREGVA